MYAETAKLTKEFIEGRKARIYDELQEIDSLTVDIHESNDIVDVKSETGSLFSEKSEAERRIEELQYRKSTLDLLTKHIREPNR